MRMIWGRLFYRYEKSNLFLKLHTSVDIPTQAVCLNRMSVPLSNVSTGFTPNVKKWKKITNDQIDPVVMDATEKHKIERVIPVVLFVMCSCIGPIPNHFV